jgi:uncharacterized membrane protein YjfL (UPF0719 family)
VGALRTWIALGVEIVQMLLGGILASLSILFAVWLFDRLTSQLDELTELREGNVAVAALLAGVIIGVSLLVGVALDGIFQLITPHLF